MDRRSLLRGLATVLLMGIIGGCEEEEPATIKVQNRWDRVVIFSVDGVEVIRLQPHTYKEHDVSEHTYKVTLALEDGTLVFEQLISIEPGQFVTYDIRSDGSVVASGGDDDLST